LWDAVLKAVLRGKFIPLSAGTGKEELSKDNNLSFNSIKLGKEEKIKSNICTQREIRARAKTNKTKHRKSIEKNQ
jgi:hypothetical protein